MTSKKTLVLGASANPARYSYLAINRLTTHGHPVIAIGKKEGLAGSVPIRTQLLPEENIDTITLYLNPGNQRPYYDYLLSLRPNRIIFNPGAENEELETLAREKGIKTLEACTLVLLGTGQY
jgi:predicted CoA-binding protein